MNNVIQSTNPNIDTLKCPKCGALWRAEGEHAWGEENWTYKLNEELCPRSCRNLFGFRIEGKVQ